MEMIHVKNLEYARQRAVFRKHRTKDNSAPRFLKNKSCNNYTRGDKCSLASTWTELGAEIAKLARVARQAVADIGPT